MTDTPKSLEDILEQPEAVTCHVKIFYSTIEDVERKYNTFMDKNFEDIHIKENKSFYVLERDGILKMGLLVYYTIRRLKEETKA